MCVVYNPRRSRRAAIVDLVHSPRWQSTLRPPRPPKHRSRLASPSRIILAAWSVTGSASNVALFLPLPDVALPPSAFLRGFPRSRWYFSVSTPRNLELGDSQRVRHIPHDRHCRPGLTARTAHCSASLRSLFSLRRSGPGSLTSPVPCRICQVRFTRSALRYYTCFASSVDAVGSSIPK